MSDTSQKQLPLRRLARKYALQMIYQLDLAQQPFSPEALLLFWPQAEEMHQDLGEKEWAKIRPQVETFARGVTSRREAIDLIIEKFARNWSIERMAAVDRNILRLAVFELYYCHDIPAAVSINEAIDLAKAFGSDESGRFVNGILDQIRLDQEKAAKGKAAKEKVVKHKGKQSGNTSNES